MFGPYCDHVRQSRAAEGESQVQKKHSDESGMCGGQQDPQQHIHQLCILEQDMSEVICHENSAIYFSVPDHTLDWTGKKMNSATLMMLSYYI